MKSIIICIALATAPLLFPSIQPQQILAMGSKGGGVQPQDTGKDEEHREKDHEGEKPGETTPPKDSGSQKKGKSPPEKKPRLKYRDESKCQC